MTTAHHRFIVGFEGTSVPDDLRRFVARGGPPLGVALFGRNIAGPDQLRALIRELRALWPIDGPPPLVCVDQEGGAVQRLKPPAIPDVAAIPPMGEVARAATAEELRALGLGIGEDLRRYGFNVDFAPVLDVHTRPDNPIIGARAFGATPADVVARALPFAQGLEAAGIVSCGKHFPGHGDTALDSHLALPTLDHDGDRLEAIELAPFWAAVRAGFPMLMTAHIVYRALDATWPATLSPRVIPPLLREAMAFDGVVVSDDLEMRAIRDHWSVTEIAAGCVAADVDVLLVCRDLAFAEALSEAVAATDEGDGVARRRIATLRARAKDHAASV